jgi:hypothetical protein
MNVENRIEQEISRVFILKFKCLEIIYELYWVYTLLMSEFNHLDLIQMNDTL